MPHSTPKTTHYHPGVSEQECSLLSQPLSVQPQASWDMAGSGIHPDHPCSVAEALASNSCQSELSLASLACPIAPSSGPSFAADWSRGVPILEHKISENCRAPCSALCWRVRETKARMGSNIPKVSVCGAETLEGVTLSKEQASP